MKHIRLRTAHGTYLRAGDTGEVNQAAQPGPWETFTVEEVQPDPPKSVRDWRGAFLSLLGYEMAKGEDPILSYPLRSTEWRKRARQAYRDHGLTHIPLTAMPRRASDPTEHAINRVTQFADELGADGLVLCHKILTDNQGALIPNNFDWTKSYTERVVRALAGYPNVVLSLGWELPDTTRGSGEPYGTPPVRWGWSGRGERVLEFIRVIRELSDQPLYVHWRPDWWGPADGMEERQFCQQAKAAGLTGVLFQSRWEQSDEEVFRQAFTLPPPENLPHEPPGTVGRIEQQGLDFVWFEFARDWETQQRRLARYAEDGRGRGYC